jgi:hypothetical protein
MINVFRETIGRKLAVIRSILNLSHCISSTLKLDFNKVLQSMPNCGEFVVLWYTVFQWLQYKSIWKPLTIYPCCNRWRSIILQLQPSSSCHTPTIQSQQPKSYPPAPAINPAALNPSSLSPMQPQPYAASALCSINPMHPQPYAASTLCSLNPMQPRPYAAPALCSPGPMQPRPYAASALCRLSPMQPQPYAAPATLSRFPRVLITSLD